VVIAVAAKDSIGKASEAARSARRNQYVKRIIEDEALRANLLAAYTSARSAYGRVGGNGRPATQALFEDRKLQRELVEAAVALREASIALKEPPKRSRRRGGGFGRTLLVLFAGGVLALALSESLRSKVLDMLFGAEEEFDYSSTTMPAQEAPSSVGASAS
jgi:hypothetical protein